MAWLVVVSRAFHLENFPSAFVGDQLRDVVVLAAVDVTLNVKRAGLDMEGAVFVFLNEELNVDVGLINRLYGDVVGLQLVDKPLVHDSGHPKCINGSSVECGATVEHINVDHPRSEAGEDVDVRRVESATAKHFAEHAREVF